MSEYFDIRDWDGNRTGETLRFLRDPEGNSAKDRGRIKRFLGAIIRSAGQNKKNRGNYKKMQNI